MTDDNGIDLRLPRPVRYVAFRNDGSVKRSGTTSQVSPLQLAWLLRHIADVVRVKVFDLDSGELITTAGVQVNEQILWDGAEYLGPPDSNYGGSMIEVRGLVLHIAQGSYWGTIGWQSNPDADVSSHTVHGYAGERAQMLGTNLTAWTQASGNGRWVSVEHEGYSGEPLTPHQLEATAALYAWLMRVYGVPAQITDSPDGYGLGWHGMGGNAWGGHYDCPGEPIKAQRQQILDRALAINGGAPTTGDDEDMMILLGLGDRTYIANGERYWWIETAAEVDAITAAHTTGGLPPLGNAGNLVWVSTLAGYGQDAGRWSEAA